MKKLLLACLVIVVLAGVLFAVGGYLLYRAASPVLENARNYLQGLSELVELDRQITNRSQYTPPASGELSEAQMQRFVRVQDSVRATLGQRIAAIEEKHRHLTTDAERDSHPSVGEMLDALSDIANVFVEARRYQVSALNQQGFSQAEYSWVRDRVFRAAGVEMASTIDLKKLEEAVRRGTGVETFHTPDLPTIEVPEKNRALVKPHLDRMDNWIPLAFFGL